MAETARNPDALHEEIERTRDQLAGTIDTLAERVSPKNVARRSADQLRGNAESVRKKLPQGQGGDFHGALANRESESTASGSGATEMQATGEVLRSNRTLVLVGAGVGLGVLVAVVVWRRVRS